MPVKAQDRPLGGKVPAAVGTVAHRLALSQGRPLGLEGPFLTAQDTRSAAVGTGALRAQGLGLLLEENLQGALGKPRRGGQGDLLHRGEIDVESGPLVAEGS